MSRIQDIIRAKRDGARLADQDIAVFVAGLADGSWPVEQVAAMAMAICIRAMDARETAALTTAMARSGTVLDWRGTLDGPVLDKHSTGGIGDKVSLMLAPILAACGCYNPMIAGRGLGHTGGTIDKLSSIPGYDPFAGVDRFRAVVRDAGCAIVGQTADLAPADRTLYAIRDLTATIESTPLIVASILSKKLAAGLHGLVMDIKTGSGAFMATEEEATALAEAIIATGQAMGLPTRALITGMDATLGHSAGNALEVREAIAYLTCGSTDGATGPTAREPHLHAVTVALCTELLLLAGIAPDAPTAAARIETALASGAAAECFQRMVAGLGGPTDLIDHPDRHLPHAPVTRPVPAPSDGWLAAVDGKAVGEAIITLGGGRRRIEDAIDPRVGFAEVAALGARVARGDPIAVVHAAGEAAAARGVADYLAAVRIGDAVPVVRPMVRSVIS